MHKPESVLVNKSPKILRNFEIQTILQSQPEDLEL